MKERLAFTKVRWIGFAFAALIPVFGMGFGAWLLATGTVWNLSFAINYLLIPLVALCSLFQRIFSNKDLFLKGVMPVLVVITYVVVFFFSSAFFSVYARAEHYEGTQAELRYSEVTRENPLMPDWSEVGQPVTKEYYHTFIQKLFFFSNTDYLICRYTPEDYEQEKAELETEYVFQTEPIVDQYKGVLPTAEVGGYQFRVLSLEEYKKQLDYPKKLILIGYSDDAKEIVYAFFDDMDLDCMESLEAFIVDEFGWKYIR